MKPAIARTLCLCALVCAPALAVDQSMRDWPAGERQKARMPTCTANASAMSGLERKAFMSECLKGTDIGKAKCDAQATARGLKGDDRTQFLRSCAR